MQVDASGLNRVLQTSVSHLVGGSTDNDPIWRKRVGVEPTTRLAKSRIAGFEGREDHRIPFASAVCENNQRTKFAEGAQLGVPPTKQSWAWRGFRSDAEYIDL